MIHVVLLNDIIIITIIKFVNTLIITKPTKDACCGNYK